MQRDWNILYANVLKMVSYGVPESARYWDDVLDSAVFHGVTGPALSGVRILMEQEQAEIPEQVIYDWEGTLIVMELKWQEDIKTLRSLVGELESIGLKVQVLKGFGLAEYWPKPEQRPVGDIDLWTSDSEAADNFMAHDLHLKVHDRGMSCKHSHCIFNGVSIENHHNLFGNSAVERQLDREIAEMSPFSVDSVSAYGFHTLPPTANYIFLVRHLAKHFLNYDSLRLRQIMDFGLFAASEIHRIDITAVHDTFSRTGMATINDIFVTIASELTGDDLSGLIIDPDNCRTVKFAKRVLGDILRPKRAIPDDKFKAFFFRMRNFFMQSWKYRFVPDSLVDHLLHPSIFKD